MRHRPGASKQRFEIVSTLAVGRVGAVAARTALAAGLDVHVAGSGPAEDIALLAEVVIPGARAMTAEDAVEDAEIVLIAVLLHKFNDPVWPR
ncbi:MULTISPECIES: NAD(P)-binding domain-containing protein [Micrococcaceae]|uniref:NAD(P)-binding domain-containing protein n=1 Tax=Micrococcaceae TaxID=1268 RepID=UPI00135B24EE|nr:MULTISPECIES: NAD(P)-binding domain-containing protein [Micrococcaceae]MCE7482409.1 NAD(P)-binding domain-containing protein [Microbacterium profundi]